MKLYRIGNSKINNKGLFANKDIKKGLNNLKYPLLSKIKFSKKYIETYICPIFEYIISSKKNKFLMAGSQGIGKSTLMHILENHRF